MTDVILLKAFFLPMMWSLFWLGMWSLFWLGRFIYTGADVNIKYMCIVFAPWIPPVLYFFFFWWG